MADQPQPNQPDMNWAAKVQKNWILTRLGHEGLMLDSIQKQGAIVRDSVRWLQDSARVKHTEGEGGEAMGVNIGNEIHYHGWTPPQQQAAQQPQTPPQNNQSTPQATPEAGNSGPTPSTAVRLRELWPWLLAAGLGSGALGAGSAYWFSRPPDGIDTRSTLRPYDGPEPDTRK